MISRGVNVLHSAADGTMQTHQQLETLLVRRLKLREDDLWEPWKEIVKRAFLIQEQRLRRTKQ